MKVNFTTIYGKAGTGKSTKLAALICNAHVTDEYDYIVLAPTNAAVENIFETCAKILPNIDRKRFKTLHSFFKIDFINDIFIGAKEVPFNAFIDEFSLINKYTFKRCYNDLISKGCRNIIICGDQLQLNAIYNDKQYISFNKINYWNNIKNKTSISSLQISPRVLQQIHLNVFGSKKVRNGKRILLTQNLRSNENMKLLINSIYRNKRDYDYKFTTFFDVPKLIKKGYVFIASKYKILQRIYECVNDVLFEPEESIDVKIIKQNITHNSGYKTLFLYAGMDVMTIVNSPPSFKNRARSSKFYNGEVFTFTGNVEDDMLKCYSKRRNEYVYIPKIKEVDKSGSGEYYPISPLFLSTVHKSQGRSIDKIIVCIDEMFEITMLYTAMTRAREDIVFYTKETDKEKRIDALLKSACVDEFRALNVITNYMNETSGMNDVNDANYMND